LYISLTTNATSQARVYSPRYAVDTTALPPSSAAKQQYVASLHAETEARDFGKRSCHCAPDAAGARRAAVLLLTFQPRCRNRLLIFKLFM